MTRLLLLAALAAALAGCAADGAVYYSADDCWRDAECRWEWRQEEREERRWKRAEHRKRYVHHARKHHEREPYVAGWGKNHDRGPVCQGLVTATGERATSVENAEIFAWRIWQGQVAFRYGESYIDFSMAKHTRKLCSPVSIADTATGKIQQKFFGITHYRCELSGFPCRERPHVMTRDE